MPQQHADAGPSQIDILTLVCAHPGLQTLARVLKEVPEGNSQESPSIPLQAVARPPHRASGQRRRFVASGMPTAAAGLAAGAIARLTHGHVLLVVAHIDDADEAFDELISAGANVIALPALEAAGDGGVGVELFAQRLAAIRSVLSIASERPTVIVAPIAALMQLVPPPAQLHSLARGIRVGQQLKLTELQSWLVNAGYNRIEVIEEPGDFAVRGGIVDIFPVGQVSALQSTDISTGTPVRLDFFGDDVDRITEIDLESMGSDRSVKGVDLYAADVSKGVATSGSSGISFLDLLPIETTALIAETLEVVEQGRGYFERVLDDKGIMGPPAVLARIEGRFRAVCELNQFSAGATGADTRIDIGATNAPTFSKDLAEAVGDLVSLATAPGGEVVVCCQNEGEFERWSEICQEHESIRSLPPGTLRAIRQYLHRGFVWPIEQPSGPDRQIACVAYHEILNRFTVRRRAGRIKSSRAMDTFLDFTSGDYVVHVDHGIARFTGLTVMKPREVPSARAAFEVKREVEPEEYLTLEFASASKLYVPATQIDKVTKYVGGFAGKPPLSTLGGQKWKNQKERVAESVRDLASELLRVRAAREHMPGIAYAADTTWQHEFENEFPYEETEDQLAAMSEIKKDMQRPRPMDRLICGDVGFGKTELAIRAAFKAVEFGKQVAVVVPTTVLAEQHERTFRNRFTGYPFRVASISRFKTDKECRDILEELKKGRIDLIIGTHRLFSQDVHFADLGLVIIDEEQRFGVEHKESLLRLRLTVDVLTLSATPIPRTLHMAMLGIRDISSLTTAPLDRRAVVTEVFPYNEKRIQMAISRELAREGQVYFVHNRVHDIMSIADNIRRLSPEGTRIVVGHGQMPPHQLEEVMLAFIRKQADILVATTIIESGIDIATANTMLINDADRFGLADLHQLRGRVGRSKNRAYCYLLLPPDRTIKEIAQKRLKALEQFSMLGAGFKIAMRDLEIRGAGNILGAEQSGHIAAVGYEMYCHLLEESVLTLKNEKKPDAPSATALEIGISGLIPKGYIPSEQRRLEAYRRLACALTPEQLAQLRADLVDAYGEPTPPVQRLFELALIRITLARLGVRTCTIREKDIIFLAKDPAPVAQQLNTLAAPNTHVTVLPPKDTSSLSEVYLRLPPAYMEPGTLLAVLRKRLGAGESEVVTPPASVPNKEVVSTGKSHATPKKTFDISNSKPAAPSGNLPTPPTPPESPGRAGPPLAAKKAGRIPTLPGGLSTGSSVDRGRQPKGPHQPRQP